MRTLLIQQTEFGLPDVDMFASDWASQVPVHVSAPWDGQCVAATRGRKIGSLAGGSRFSVERTTRQPLVFLFPPVGKLFVVLAKVKEERAESVLVCPRRLSTAQMLMLQSLPCTAQRDLKGPLDQLMRPSVKVPPSARKGG